MIMNQTSVAVRARKKIFSQTKASARIKNWLRTRHLICQGNFFILETLEYPTIERFEECISSLGGTLISVHASQKVWIGKHRQVILYRAKASLNTLNHELKQYWFKYGGINSKFESIDSSQKKLSQLN